MPRSVRHSAASPHKMPQASSGTAGITVSSDPRFAIGGVWLLGNRRVGCGLRTMRDEGGAECWEMPLCLQPAEALGDLEHGGGGPAQCHGGIAPAFHVA